MQSATVRSVRGGVLRRTLHSVGGAAAASYCTRTSPLAAPKLARRNAWNSRHGDAQGASFSTARATPLSRSLQSDIQALQHLHALLSVPQSPLSQSFDAVMQRLERCHTDRCCVFVTGIGKSGIVARRLAATLASISVRSQWVHGSEWTHGDLGNLHPGDVVIMLSHSGNTAELQSLPSLAAARTADTIAIVGHEFCALAEACSLTLVVPANDPPHCPVPSRSIVVQEAICNAIVEHFVDSVTSRPESFRDNHPGGAIGNGFSRS